MSIPETRFFFGKRSGRQREPIGSMYDSVGDFFIDLCAPSVEGRTSALKERSQNPLFNTLQGELKATLFSKAEHLLRRKKKTPSLRYAQAGRPENVGCRSLTKGETSYDKGSSCWPKSMSDRPGSRTPFRSSPVYVLQNKFPWHGIATLLP